METRSMVDVIHHIELLIAYYRKHANEIPIDADGNFSKMIENVAMRKTYTMIGSTLRELHSWLNGNEEWSDAMLEIIVNK